MNPVIKAQISDYVQSTALKNESESNQFEVYSIFSVVNGFMGESIDAYDVHLKGSEFGVDGIAIIVQGEIVKNRQEAEEKLDSIRNPTVDFVFFQSKTSTSYDYGDLSKFFDAIEGFFSGDLASESDQIADLVDAMRAIYERGVGRRNPSLNAFYVATGNYDAPKRIEKLRENFLTDLGELNILDIDRTTVAIVGAKELQRWYRAATTSVEVDIEFAKAVVMPTNTHVEEAYVGYLPAKQLVKLFTLYDTDDNVVGINKSVFFDNIRDYDPNSKINKEIKESVNLSGGRDFVFRNNGITVVSKNIDRTGDKFKLEDYQIVNGCQTSNIIYDIIFGVDKADYADLRVEENIAVPFRLIGSKNDEFVASIILGTNRQNPVKDEQFWALRPFMKSFEEYARSVDAEEVIYFERRENQYRGQRVERVRIIQPSVMMKALAASILYQPHRAGRDYRGIISEYNNNLFQEDHDVRIYHAACYLFYRLEFLWRNQRIDNAFKIFRFYIMCTAGFIVTGGRDVFGLKKSKIEKIAKNIISLAKSEEALVTVANRTATIIEEKLKSMGLSSPARMRDTIRSETFANEFMEALRREQFPGHNDYLVD